MLSLQDVIARNTAPAQPTQNSLQLLVNRFAHRYDANLREYTEITLLQVLSGGVKPRQS